MISPLNNFVQIIKDKIDEILRAEGVQIVADIPVNINRLSREQFGDLNLNTHVLRKSINSEIEFSVLIDKINNKLKNLENNTEWPFTSIYFPAGFINFYFRSNIAIEEILEAIKNQKKYYGVNDFGGENTVVIEYPSNNTHKELHIGHLRNICIGNSLIKLFENNGFKVTPINYLNDFGAHVAKCLWGLQKFHNGEKPPKGNEQKWLGEIYAEASNYLKDHEEEKKDVYEVQKKLEARDKSVWPLYKKTRKWSIDGFDKYFKELSVKHDHTFYEQDVKDEGQKIVDDLSKKNIAKVGDGGAIIADLNEYKLDIALLRKSNGAGLYLTSDLGLAVAKNKKYSNIAESIHLTGSEQNFYFKQLFKILELAGYKYKMTHIGYGLVMLPEGKMSSRTGKVVLYEDLRNLVNEKVLEETTKRHTDWSQKKIEQTSLKIALAAIKFEFLKHEASKTIIFDAQSAVKFEGFTGPYVLYMIARINSILRKAKSKNFRINYNLLKESEEKQLALLLGEFSDVVKKSFDNYNPSVITKYSFDVAQSFSNFYSKHSVLNTEDKDLSSARLVLCAATKQVLENCLNILSIETIKEM